MKSSHEMRTSVS